ncbi:MAG: alpha/beta hydrolase [Egibacteraceae bacterium]
MIRRRAIGAMAFAGAAAGSAALGHYAKRRAIAGIEPLAESTWADLCRPVHGRVQTVRSCDGTRLHVEVLGPDDAPTILLAHGYTLSQHAWHYQRRALSARFRLVCYDQRGHAASAVAAAGDYSMGALGRDVAAVLDATTVPGGPVVAVGHSMGGMAILSFAEQFPEQLDRVAGVALVSTAAGSVIAGGAFTAGAAVLAVLRGRLPGVRHRAVARSGDPADWPDPAPPDLVFLLTRSLALHPDADPAHIAFTEQLMMECPAGVKSALGPTLTSVRLAHIAERLTMPGLVMVGEHDRLTPLGPARRLAEAMPDARLVVLPGAGHMAPLEAHERVSAELAAFADQVLAGRPRSA